MHIFWPEMPQSLLPFPSFCPFTMTTSPSQLPETCPKQNHQIRNIPDEQIKAQRLQRAQWLRAAVLGANDGLISTASLMLGVGAVHKDGRFVVLSGLAGALAGAFSMAVGEFVAVSTQLDIEMAILKSPDRQVEDASNQDKLEIDKEVVALVANPYKSAGASALAFLCGSVLPLMAAVIVPQRVIRIVAIAVVASIAMALFGGLGAYFGGSKIGPSALRVMVGGSIAMALSYGLLKPFDADHN